MKLYVMVCVYIYRYAVVTGANKGIGLEIVRQLASQGITVILTARDETRGLNATSNLHQMGLSNVIFHQLDVLDPTSVEFLAKFIHGRFGRLDILVIDLIIFLSFASFLAVKPQELIVP